MSRRRGEFEHRTSIFEGAFRAWSHLGGLSPEDVESKPAPELDPLTNPIENDPRIKSGNDVKNPDGTPRREYPYEPLPRSGLAHPYVQAILSPWLGPDADNEAIQLGLTTLRTWWQHRRKGESGSAIAALGTEKMKGVVEGYTRHFFTLAHCLVVNDKEQPPRTLHGKLKELDKLRSKKARKRGRSQDDIGGGSLGSSIQESMTSALTADLTDTNLSPLERLHAAQQRQLAESNFTQGVDNGISSLINIKGKCVPGKVDLPGVVDAVTRNAQQLSHRGGSHSAPTSSSSAAQKDEHGANGSTPVVYVTGIGEAMIAMKIDGITCAHCVKIVETVLKGCNGSKSPIEGLLDATADRALCSVIIKIDQPGSADRVSFEAARNLAMVGYTATPVSMTTIQQNNGEELDRDALSAAFMAVAGSDGSEIFDWSFHCSCPDTGVLQQDCARHSQMNSSIFDAFESRKQQILEYIRNNADGDMPFADMKDSREDAMNGTSLSHSIQPNIFDTNMQVDSRMNFLDIEPPSGAIYGSVIPHAKGPPHMSAAPPPQMPPPQPQIQIAAPPPAFAINSESSTRAQRNPSVISYGNRHMSITSETTFGRAMSGLSALSIDWENLDDFDIEVDHSAHINNSPTKPIGGSIFDGPRRSSIRRSAFAHSTVAAAAAVASATSGDSPEGAHVTFKE